MPAATKDQINIRFIYSFLWNGNRGDLLVGKDRGGDVDDVRETRVRGEGEARWGGAAWYWGVVDGRWNLEKVDFTRQCHVMSFHVMA